MTAQSIGVELRADPDPLPAAFTWQGVRWVINSRGRSWNSDGEKHYLVMVQGDRVFEIAQSHETGEWRLVRSPGDFGPPRKPTSSIS